MTDFKLTYHRFSEHSILVKWPQEIDEKTLRDVLLFKNHLQNKDVKSILNIVNAYSSILVNYTCTIDNIYDEFLILKEEYLCRVGANNHIVRHWKIPVCYDEKFGIDLDEISNKNLLSKSEIIKIHSETIYIVCFIGFLPGFLYLGGLDNRLFFPRKSKPRWHVEKGAVAIGNNQTGIYPNSSPAGWNIIGNSPLNFFDVSSSEPCFAKSGDKIEFISITLDEHDYISKAVRNGTYALENEIIHD